MDRKSKQLTDAMLGSLLKLPLILKQKKKKKQTKYSILKVRDIIMSVLQMRKPSLTVSLVSWSQAQDSNPSLPEALPSPQCQTCPLPANVAVSTVIWSCVTLPLEYKWPIVVFIEHLLNVEYYRESEEQTRWWLRCKRGEPVEEWPEALYDWVWGSSWVSTWENTLGPTGIGGASPIGGEVQAVSWRSARF